MNKTELMNRAADNIRILAAAAVEKAKSGHPGGAMGGADFINVLYSEFIEQDPDNPEWEARDRFFLDPGHMAPMLYSQLCLAGKFSLDELAQLRQWGSPTTGHPEYEVARGIENTSGPLGQGHAYAIGAAIAAKFLAAHTGNPTFAKETIYAYISDGGIQEEVSQGAGRIAGTLGLDNLIMFYDSNDIQLSTECAAVTSEDVAQKYASWGWKVITIDGHDVAQIRAALDEAKAENERPTLIVGKCIMGKGALKADGSSYERNCATHGAPLGGDAYVTADAGDAAECAYPDMLVCRLMEANCLWADSSGFTYALDDRNHVVLQDRRPAAWFADGRAFAAYLGDLEDARRLARDLIAFGKEASDE